MAEGASLDVATESPGHSVPSQPSGTKATNIKPKARGRDKGGTSAKRRCVSTACIACRRRKSKCDGNMPSCAACASVYSTECVYDPNSDHRRKGVYANDLAGKLKTRNSTLQTVIEGILNYPDSEVLALVKQIRTCESLDDVAEGILARNAVLEEDAEELDLEENDNVIPPTPKFEAELSGRMGELRLENGSAQFVGGTSNLLYLDSSLEARDTSPTPAREGRYSLQEDAIRSWTSVTADKELIVHLLNMYFTWHYAYFTTLSKALFFRDFFRGKPADAQPSTTTEHCTPLLVNAMLALGCHFTSWPTARADPEDSGTAGDHFFKEAKKLIVEDEAFATARLATVQALALMSVREAGCGREAKGWVYSGMSFRMAFELGLPYDWANTSLEDEEIDARRITFWGCFLFDKCWSNYLGRPPILSLDNITVEKFVVFPAEDADSWSPWTDAGLASSHTQPARTRATALQISHLCEISNDILVSFYRQCQMEKPFGKQAELRKLSDIHMRLEAWRKDLPKEMEPKEGQLPHVLLMHMFSNLLFIHLFRPFLRYSQNSLHLPAQVSPRRHCIQAAAAISKLLRLYRRTYSLRQICNTAVYMVHSACTIHLLNLPEKDARRDLIHGLRNLEEIADSWLCARRTLGILLQQVRKWDIELPEEAAGVFERSEAKFNLCKHSESLDSRSETRSPRPSEQICSANASPLGTPSPSITGDSTAFFPSPAPFPINTNRFTSAPRVKRAASPAEGVSRAGPAQQVSFQRQPDGSALSQLQAGEAPGWTPRTPRDPAALPPDLTLRSMAPSFTNVFGERGSAFPESRDWWVRDQFAIIDNWAKPGGSGNFNAYMANNAGTPAVTPAGSSADEMINEYSRVGYLDFGAEGYSFDGGSSSMY